MTPCRVCGNRDPQQLNRHHLLPKSERRKGTRQITVKLCRDNLGCEVHRRFHQGFIDAAILIRSHLTQEEVDWMRNHKGKVWVDIVYPKSESRL